MAWIRLIQEHEAEGELKELYEKAGRGGKVASVTKAGCYNPPALAARHAMFRALMYRRDGLSRPERELVAVVTSVANGCHY